MVISLIDDIREDDEDTQKGGKDAAEMAIKTEGFQRSEIFGFHEVIMA